MSNENEAIDDFENQINYALCHAETDLDYDGYFCIEDVQLIKDFTGDNNDYIILSENTLSTEEWKKDKRDISVSFNTTQKDVH